MIKINCETKDTIKLTDMVPFQGKLKKRTDQDIKELIDSLTSEGLMMPFAIWTFEDKHYLLDGHGRKEALIRMSIDEPDLLNEDWPCIYIQAETENDARKALLQITSSYGKITKQGVKQFTVSIPNYKAPCIAKFVAKPVKANKDVVKSKAKQNSEIIMKIRVKIDKLDQVKEILGKCSFIEVL